MEKAKVYFTDFHATPEMTLPQKTAPACEKGRH